MVEILVDGVEQSKREVALKELESTLEHASQLQLPIDKIIVAKDFRGTVRSYTGLLDYEPTHEYGLAVAKALPVGKNSDLRFIVVLNGEVFGSWSPEMRLDRMKSLWHEFIHIRDMTRQAQAIGMDAFFSEPKNKRDALLQGSWNIWMEYNAERFLAESLVATIAEIGVEYDLLTDTAEYARRLGELLDDLRDYLNANIRDLRAGEVVFDKAVRRVTSRLTSVLILMAYVHSKIDLDARIKSSVLELRQKQNFLLFLSEDFDSIMRLLEELYVRGGEYCEELLERMAGHLDSIYKRWGMQIQDVEEGLHIYLHPV